MQRQTKLNNKKMEIKILEGYFIDIIINTLAEKIESVRTECGYYEDQSQRLKKEMEEQKEQYEKRIESLVGRVQRLETEKAKYEEQIKTVTDEIAHKGWIVDANGHIKDPNDARQQDPNDAQQQDPYEDTHDNR